MGDVSLVECPIKDELVFLINSKLPFEEKSYRQIKALYSFLSIATLHRLYDYKTELLSVQFLMILVNKLDHAIYGKPFGFGVTINSQHLVLSYRGILPHSSDPLHKGSEHVRQAG